MPGKNEIVKKVRTFFSSSNQAAFRRKMAHEIKHIREKLERIAAIRERFLLEESYEEILSVGRVRESHSSLGEDDLDLRVVEKENIVKLLLNPNQNRTQQEKLSVLPIVGMGGLGKTTLAKLVYNDERVLNHFELKTWVCVSDNFDQKLLLEKIVESITNENNAKDKRMEELQDLLQKKINDKRYLLVLDDVWNENPQEWQGLKGLLKNCGEGSRIIVTTRSENVANTTGTMERYPLGFVDEEKSWSLFSKIAFEGGREPTDKKIASEIVRKCNGVPLAITMIGSLIRSRGKNINWEHFHGSELSDMIPGEENSVLKTLRLSYDYLPSHLKPCFAFCSLFPKDHVFKVKTLIMQWIAQGLIKSSKESQSDLEDRGYEYFADLYSRFFFQDGERDKQKKVKRCKMHDLVHDLAVEIAGEKYKMLSSEVRICAGVHHLSFNFDLDSPKEMPNVLAKAKRLRTILFVTEQYPYIYKGEVGRAIFKEIFSNFRLLRMLDMQDLGLETVPNSIGKLKHLRYLDLSGNRITSLPASITKLVNLQTLKLNRCRVLRELPRDINKLVNLRHVEFDNSEKITHIPRGLGELTNLQTLSKLGLSEDHPHSGKLGVLKRLNNLRGRLAIEGIRGGMKSADANLQAKEHLRSLHLHWSREGALTDQEWGNTLSDLQPHSNLSKLAINSYDGTKLPNWLSSLTNLVELDLRDCSKCQELPSLDQLLNLKKMELDGLEALEYIVTNVDLVATSPVELTLSSLQQLTLNDLPEFRGWWSSKKVENQEDQALPSYFTCLTKLTINNCPKLTSMPLYPNVEELTLYNSCLKPFEQTRLLAHASQRQIAAAAATTTTIEEASSSSSGNSLAFLALLKLRLLEVLQNLSDWMKGLSSPACLRIDGFLGQQCLSPGIQHLTSLQKLEIKKCEKLEIFDGEILTGLRTLVLEELPKLRYLSSGIQCLTSLESLEIRDCKELELISNDADPIKWENLTSLRSLEINGLPKLRNLCPGIQYLTSLEDLQISKCEELELLRPDGTDMIIWKNLTSLRTLHLEGLPKLRFLCPGIQNLPSLQILVIENCEELELIPNDGTESTKWENLTSLNFRRLPKLVALPEGLQRATTLQYLAFIDCDNLTAIPDWISSLCSLQHLYISFCPKMESLPGSISQITSLQMLWIHGCPKLSKRCRTLAGEDWIKRIPYLELGFPDDEPTPGCRPATILNNFRKLLPSCNHSTS